MKRETRVGLAMIVEAGTPLPLSPRGAADALATDAEVKRLRGVLKAIRDLKDDRCTVTLDGPDGCGCPTHLAAAALKSRGKRHG